MKFGQGLTHNGNGWNLNLVNQYWPSVDKLLAAFQKRICLWVRVEINSTRDRGRASDEPSLFSDPSNLEGRNSAPTPQGTSAVQSLSPSSDTSRSIDDLAEWIIAESFRPAIIGEAILIGFKKVHAIDRSIALAAIVAKAIDARRKRSAK